MHVRFHILPASAAPSASLFALRHNAGHLLRDGDGKVILRLDAEAAERERRRNSASAPVSYVVALIPESDVREVDAVERLAEVLAMRLAPADNGAQILAEMRATEGRVRQQVASEEAPATGGDVQSDDSVALRAAEQVAATMKIGDTERPIMENTAGQWTDTPPATEIPPVAITLDPRVSEALTNKAPRKGRRQ